MNKHFKDAWYYLRRSGNHLKRGVRAEFQTGKRKIRARTGEERPSESEATRREKMRTNVREVERKVKRRSRDAVKDARKRIRMS
ncbi:DUF7553 family protein [Haladaptatus caseinilyticus]|uniref:DUF7553 family protein n=1 Tax=Haladaptatus caseinilyticus TaxID=2993314 RepID=UPI00224B1BBD|nr:hypothetical protein [Haladaptatus caseinilyticus]